MAGAARSGTLVSILAVVCVALAIACSDADAERIEVRVGGLTIQAEVARTVEERAQGLSGRDSLPRDAGMLFVLDEEGRPGFWMKDMRFPLDFIWISRDRHVVDLTENVPDPETAGTTVSGIQPDQPALYVLEVNAGVVQEYGVQAGDAVSFEPDVAPPATP
jgi:uncharacterized membrane protein (UPF0127 family)